jgi:hypothetical protein
MATAEKLRDLNGPQAFGTLKRGYRAIKFVFPRCNDCQKTDRAFGWWNRCKDKGHDPYIQKTERPVTKPILKQLEDGRTIVERHETVIEYDEAPNLKEVEASDRHGGQIAALARARAKGGIAPHAFGLLHYCEFSGCWEQGKLCEKAGCWDAGHVHKTRRGYYCRKDQAQSVGLTSRRDEEPLKKLPALAVLTTEGMRDAWRGELEDVRLD